MLSATSCEERDSDGTGKQTDAETGSRDDDRIGSIVALRLDGHWSVSASAQTSEAECSVAGFRHPVMAGGLAEVDGRDVTTRRRH